jgi:hypothetical protein
MTKSTPQFMGYSNLHVFAIIVLISIVAFEMATAEQLLLSEQCKSETLALASNQALQAVAPSIECNIYVDILERCTADFADSSYQYRDLCLDAGGQFFTNDVTFDGTTILSGVTYNTDYKYLNFPTCVGASCNVYEIKAEFENNVIPSIQQILTSDGFTGKADSANEKLADVVDNGNSDAGNSLFNLKNIGFIYSVVGWMVASLTVSAM